MTNSQKRPLGIRLLAIWFILNGSFDFVVNLYNILSGGSFVLARALLLPKYFLLVLHLIGLLLNIWTISLGIGLWKMWRWSWICTLATLILGILMAVAFGVFSLLRGGLSGFIILQLVSSIAFSTFIIYYLLRPQVKAAFKID